MTWMGYISAIVKHGSTNFQAQANELGWALLTIALTCLFCCLFTFGGMMFNFPPKLEKRLEKLMKPILNWIDKK